MIIACPRCETTFSLPDELYKPGKKARCSQCANVFPMPATSGGDGSYSAGQADKPAVSFIKRHITAILAAVSVCLLMLLGYGGYLVYSAFQSSALQSRPDTRPNTLEPTGKERHILSVGLDEVKQFQVDNANIGKLIVIQGEAVNISQINKDFIAVEARLLDINGKVLASVQQLVGVRLTLFQLQTLGQAELRNLLNRRDTIMINNTNLPPQSRTPFVVVFPKPPAETRNFVVEVIDVHDSPRQEMPH